jgi:hypothetical protein
MYAKVFAQILNSTISEDYVVRHVFMDLLILANRYGEVDMTATAIARVTNVPLEQVTHAISALMREDAGSRSKEFGGKRLILLDEHRDWGWKIINYETYNRMQTEEAKRTYFREYKARKRAEKLAEKNKVESEEKEINVLDNSRTSKDGLGNVGLSNHVDVDIKATTTPLSPPKKQRSVETVEKLRRVRRVSSRPDPFVGMKDRPTY